jgi:hypothetical protein
MIDEYVAFGGTRTDRKNPITRIKPASMSLCPPQIPDNLGD